MDQSALVGALELVQQVLLALLAFDHNPVRVNEGDGAVDAGEQNVAGVERSASFHAGSDQWRVGYQQRNCLALHVRAHQGAVGVVVLEEGNHRRGNRPKLLR